MFRLLTNILTNDYPMNDLETRQLKGAAPTDAGNGNAVLTSTTTIVPKQFRDDVKKMKAYVGAENWIAGLKMELTLQELLIICPRERKRSDAYRKLINYLASELGITLNIKKKGGRNAYRKKL